MSEGLYDYGGLPIEGACTLDAETFRRWLDIIEKAHALERASRTGSYMREHLALCEAVRALKSTPPTQPK